MGRYHIRASEAFMRWFYGPLHSRRHSVISWLVIRYAFTAAWFLTIKYRIQLRETE